MACDVSGESSSASVHKHCASVAMPDDKMYFRVAFDVDAAWVEMNG